MKSKLSLMKFSSDILQPVDKLGNVPHLFPGGKLQDPSNRIVKDAKYLLL